MGQKIKPRVYTWLFTMSKIRGCHGWLESVVSRLLLETMILLVRCSDLEGVSIKTRAIFTKKIPCDPENTARWHTDFHYFRTLYAFPVIRIPTRHTPLAAPCGRTVWIFSRFSNNEWKLPKRHTNDLASEHPRVVATIANDSNIAKDTSNAWENRTIG